MKQKLGFKLTTAIAWRHTFTKLDQVINGDTEQSELAARISPSLFYFINDQFALLASIGGLRIGKTFNGETDDVTFFNLSLRSGSFFGMRYFWGGGEGN